MTTEPTGVWAEAIRHLREAEHLMSLIDAVPEMRDATNLADPYRAVINQMIRHITVDYEYRWWEIATQPTRVVLTPVYDEDGNVRVEVRPQT